MDLARNFLKRASSVAMPINPPHSTRPKLTQPQNSPPKNRERNYSEIKVEQNEIKSPQNPAISPHILPLLNFPRLSEPTPEIGRAHV